MRMKWRAVMPRKEVVWRRYRAGQQRVKGNLGARFSAGKEREWCKGAVVCSAELGMPFAGEWEQHRDRTGISYRGSSWGKEQQVRNNGKTVGGGEHTQTERSDFLLHQT